MSAARLDRIVRAAAVPYRSLLVLYPGEYRRRVGSDQVDAFVDICRAAASGGGVRGLLAAWGRGLIDLLASGAAERVRPFSNGPQNTPRRGDPRVTIALHDLKLAVRALALRPLFSLLAIGMLTIGIGGNAMIFSLFNGLYLRPLPFPEGERLVDLDETAPQWNLEYVAVAYPDFHHWRASNQSFEAIGASDDRSFNLAGPEGAERVRGYSVSWDFNRVLGLSPILGRDFVAADDVPEAPAVALLGHGLWERMFGASEEIVGQTIRLDSEPVTVIGVMPATAVFPRPAGVWVPLRQDPEVHNGYFMRGIGRLKPGVTLDAAREDLRRIHLGLAEQQEVNEITSPTVAWLRDRYFGEVRAMNGVLLAAVGLVLLIACANIAGMLLARATERRAELGVRAALGASRGRLLSQLMAETLLLAGIGGLLGAGLGFVGLRVLLARIPTDRIAWIDFSFDVRFVLFSIGLTALAALAAGLAPALQASRGDIHGVLHDGATRASAGGSRRWSLNALVVSEVAMACVLLVGAALLFNAFLSMSAIEPGFRTDNVLTYAISLPQVGYPEDPDRVAFFDEHLAAVSSLPGVLAAGAVSTPPLGSHSGYFMDIEGAPERVEGDADPVILVRAATPGYFDAMGITLLAGRQLDPGLDGVEAEPVLIVNEAFAERFWPGATATGKRARFRGSDNDWIDVVGVNRNVRHYGLDEPMRPGVYLPHAWFGNATMTLAVRTDRAAEMLVAPIRELVREADAALPIYGVRSQAERLADSTMNRRLYSSMFGIFAAVALALAIGGIYGVVSYAVSQRTREIGIRMALGARRSEVLGQVLRQGLVLVGLGVGLGLVGAVIAAQAMRGVLLGVSSTDPTTYLAVAAGLVIVAVLASIVPARRAASIDPARALRSD